MKLIYWLRHYGYTDGHIWRVPVINYMSRPLDRLLMNYCHWVPSVLKLLAR